MGRLETPSQSPNEVKFFKIDEYTEEIGTGKYGELNMFQRLTSHPVKWASDKLIRQNYTWTSRIPSDIKPGLYILRHELLALHDPKRSYNGLSQSGVQAFPVCYNVDITGPGTVAPTGKTFPCMYAKNDPGIEIDPDAINAPYVGNSRPNILRFVLTSMQTAPGLPKYNGKYDALTGHKPTVKETGDVPAAMRANYNKKKAIAQFISVWTTEGRITMSQALARNLRLRSIRAQTGQSFKRG